MTKIQLDLIAAGGCTVPNCKDPLHGERFHVRGQCHPRSLVDVSYTRRVGVLVITCGKCHQVLASVAVKEA